MELYQGVEANKTVFAGLDKAGKSSIILALQKELSQLAALKPTRLAQRKIFDFMGKKIAAWDLGGQERYRETYLETPEKYFDKTRFFIYVIDLQDSKRFQQSIDYLKQIHDILKDFELNPRIYIFLHKFDPEFEEEISKSVDDEIEKLKEDIRTKLGNDETIFFYKTSIYRLFSITTAFTKVVNESD